MTKTLRLSLLALGLFAAAGREPAQAADAAQLRGDIVATRDALTLGDLVVGAPSALAETPLFRAPSLGQSGTIQTRRIVEAAHALGLPRVETGGRLQVSVARAARQVGAAEIEAAVKRALERQTGIDPRNTGIAFDGAAAPALVLPPDAKGEAIATDVLFDRRSRRVSALVRIGEGGDARPTLRVSGAVVETVEVAVLSRSLERGDSVKAADVTLEHRPRDLVPADATLDGAPLEGRVARRSLGAGSLLRSGDLMRPELVARGEVVTMVYEAPGVLLSMRARASEAGALGDTIPVVNPGSKKTVQATVIGPGKVSVSPAQPQRVVASAAASARP